MLWVSSARRGTPDCDPSRGTLIVGVGIGENYFASDVTALVAYTKNVIYLEDGGDRGHYSR